MPDGTFYTETRVIQLGPAVDGRFSLFVVTDAGDAVYEHTDAANAAGPGHWVDIMPKPYADLVVDAFNLETAGHYRRTL